MMFEKVNFRLTGQFDEKYERSEGFKPGTFVKIGFVGGAYDFELPRAEWEKVQYEQDQPLTVTGVVFSDGTRYLLERVKFSAITPEQEKEAEKFWLSGICSGEVVSNRGKFERKSDGALVYRIRLSAQRFASFVDVDRTTYENLTDVAKVRFYAKLSLRQFTDTFNDRTRIVSRWSLEDQRIELAQARRARTE